MAQSQNIPIVLEENEISEGWVGKPKGMRQVLWEHGLLDLNIAYVAKLKKDDPNLDGKVEYGSILADCADYSAKNLFDAFGGAFSVEVDQSTKSYPELAGEGIEYSWG
jgi:hypothetical protein